MNSKLAIALLGLGLIAAPPSAFAATATPSANSPGAAANAVPARAGSCPSLLDHTFPRLQDDVPQDLCQFAGKLVLIVNTASYCGFTHQYEGLEKLYERYHDRGLVVLGFPSNDFGRQEPGSSKQIADFCENTFGVRFPMFAKTRVVGSESHPLFAALAREAGAAPRWNFHKYLIGRDGKALAAFPSAVDPLDDRVIRAIESSLGEPRARQR